MAARPAPARPARAPGVVGALALALALALAPAGCDAPPPDDDAASGHPDSATHAQAPERLLERTERVMGFLRGSGSLDTLLLADTVALHVAPDGGGESVRLPRGRLRDPESWRVGPHRLVPPAGLEPLTLEPGRHFSCLEGDLSARDSALAERPHVGARLGPPPDGSCLQTWNMTFVFDAHDPPRILAVVYDQWEW